MSNILTTSPLDNRHFSAEIASKLGDINAAVIIQQLHYWLQKNVGIVIDGVKWVYNSFESWVREQFKWLSVWQFRQAMNLLRSLEIVKVIRYRAKEWNQTNHYTLNYDRLHGFLGTESTEAKTAETTENSDLCNNTDQGVTIQQIEVRTAHNSYKESEKTSLEDQTAKQSVAASPENEIIEPLGEPEAKVSQSQVTGLKQDLKGNSGAGNALDGVEASSAKCSIKVINKEWKTHLDQLDSLGVGINSTVVKVVKVNQKENVERAVALLKARKRDGHVSNPAGYFVQALKQNWASEVSSTEDSQSLFRYWYQLARELGYCQGAEVREGEQWVLLSGNWENWESAVNRGYNVEYLRKVLGRNKQK
ncbi:MAG: hypothetical protein QNJ60_13655 [Xenococcaceae cyanobacterium MO_188.B19]|nr:hypothetical protein [Xenococcaceae cyanobacterium MO_188.B19]